MIDADAGDDTVYGDNGVNTCVLPITGQPGEPDAAGGADKVYGGTGATRSRSRRATTMRTAATATT